MAKQVDDEQIVRMWIDPNRQSEAFKLIVKAYSESLYWQIRRVVFSHDDADDVMQNTFMKAWLNRDSFKGDSKLSTWLYRIAINESITFLNKKKLRGEVSIDDVDNTVLEHLESDPYFEGDALQARFQMAVQSLPAKQRQVFTLRYYEQMKYEDMSKLLNTTVGALKASYHHAALKIRDAMEKFL